MTPQQYRFNEFFGLFDSSSSAERILAYRQGWDLFEKEELHPIDFKLFHERKLKILQVGKYLISLSLLSAAIFLIVAVESPLKFVGVSFLFFGAIMAFYATLGTSLKSLRETRRFFTFIDQATKPENYQAFLSLSPQDREGAEIFYSKFRRGEDFQGETEESANYDKTVSLLAIELLLGELGILNDFKQKLLQQDHSIKSGAFDKVLSKVVGGTDRGIRDYFSKISPEIANSRCLSSKRKEQLLKVKEIFITAGLREKALFIDDFIQKRADL
jgi:hypothetical protein